MINFNEIKYIHFIGIGGIGNSAIAEILLDKNIKISGSDINKSKITDNLKSKGAIIFIGHNEDNIKIPDLIVYSSAINKDNLEYKKAIELNIPLYNRAEILGELMSDYDLSVAISGTHGKTTTTSMITSIMQTLKLNPTSLIGGTLESINGNALIGDSEIFITESCEYKENFLNLKPKYGIILNIEEDHLDYYTDLDHIISSFIKFSQNIDVDGALIVNNDDYNTKRIKQYVDTNVITIGINQECDYQAKNITFNNHGYANFDVYHNNEFLGNCSLNVPGTHNIYNALSALVLSSFFEADFEALTNAISEFTGVRRRFDIRGSYNNATIVDDYAHHPTEIKVTIATAKKMNFSKVRCVFQPHTYSRTKELLPEFGTAFSGADEIIVTDIYAAREINTYNISALDLVNEIKKEHSNVIYLPTLDECTQYLKDTLKENELALLLGAGNIIKISEDLMK